MSSEITDDWTLNSEITDVVLLWSHQLTEAEGPEESWGKWSLRGPGRNRTVGVIQRSVGMGWFKNSNVGMGWFKNSNVGMGWFKNNNVGMAWIKNNNVGMGWVKNNNVKEVETPPARSNLCTALTAVSTAVRIKVTKTVSKKQLLRNNSGGTKSQCRKSSC